jgi:DNA polymerase-3 subunit alpha
VVIGEKPLIEILPLARDKSGEVVTQFEMKPLGSVGLLKMDFLGLKTLTVIQEAVEHIRARHGITVDINQLPVDDPATFDLLNRGDTIGVFQVESKGMRDLLRRIGLTNLADLIAMIALFRRGRRTCWTIMSTASTAKCASSTTTRSSNRSSRRPTV